MSEYDNMVQGGHPTEDREDDRASRSRRRRKEKSRRREGGDREDSEKDRRRSRKRNRSRSGSKRRRRRRKLPGLWDSTEPVQNQLVVESMLMGDPKTRECYIGHLPPGCNPRMLEDLFNALFAVLPEYKQKYADNPPVIKAQMYGNGTFAFVEFRSKEVAQTAIKFDQVVLMNHPLHIGRPQGFVPPPPGCEAPALDITPLLQAGLIPAPPQLGQLPPMLGGPPMMMGGMPGGPPMMGGPMQALMPPMPGNGPPQMGGPPMGGPPQMGMMGGPPMGGPPADNRGPVPV